MPFKAYEPLVFNPDTVLSFPLSLQYLKVVCRRDSKVFKVFGSMYHDKLPFSETLNALRQFVGKTPIKYLAERTLELAKDPEVISPKVRNIPTTEKPGEGIGIIEALRGTLIHHYWSDEDGMVEKVNLIVATGHNKAGMCMSVKRAAERLRRLLGLVRDLLIMEKAP